MYLSILPYALNFAHHINNWHTFKHTHIEVPTMHAQARLRRSLYLGIGVFVMLDELPKLRV